VLRRPQVSAAITGATRVEQLDENLRSLEVKLSDAEWRDVEAAVAGISTARRGAAARGRTARRGAKGRRA
jgi:aryl-alcohol dehydrogenase-like predicted oxidoreductase